MLKKILIGLTAVIALILIAASFQPDEFKISRSASINASPDRVFSFVNDFHKWGVWSPWEQLDPQMKRTYEGPESGVGAVYSWVGNKEVGEGKMTIIESRSPSLIHINLQFIKPMEGTNLTEFAFTPEGDATGVTWTMSGKNNFIGKIFCLFMNMDKMIGPDFEKGLANLKTAAEAK